MATENLSIDTYSETVISYRSLSVFYFIYFAALGTLLPFWGPFLASKGFSEVVIGQLLAVLWLVKMLTPYIWGNWADKRGTQLPFIRFAAIAAGICSCGLFWSVSTISMAIVLAAFSFFWSAVLPLFETLTLRRISHQPHWYSRIRLWGSVGFILAVSSTGFIFEYLPWKYLPILVFGWILAVIGLSFILIKKQSSHIVKPESISYIWDIIKQPAVLALLGCCFLMQCSHGPYYTFYSIYLSQQGYSMVVIGFLWAIGVTAEVVLFFILPTILVRVNISLLIVISLLITIVRWLLIGLFPQSLIVLVIAQLAHAASYGAFHVGAISLIHRFFAGHSEGRGQALYSSVSFGAGSAVGASLAGFFWSLYSPTWTFIGASGLCLCSFMIAWRWLYPLRMNL